VGGGDPSLSLDFSSIKPSWCCKWSWRTAEENEPFEAQQLKKQNICSVVKSANKNLSRCSSKSKESMLRALTEHCLALSLQRLFALPSCRMQIAFYRTESAQSKTRQI
jgi:hypothetical protein